MRKVRLNDGIGDTKMSDTDGARTLRPHDIVYLAGLENELTKAALAEDMPKSNMKWCEIHNEPYLYECHRCHNDGIGA